MADTRETPEEGSELLPVGAEGVKPEEKGTLSLHYVDGIAQLVVTGGTAVLVRDTVRDQKKKDKLRTCLCTPWTISAGSSIG